MNQVLLAFLKKGLYAVIANLLAMLSLGLTGFVPAGTAVELAVYGAIASALTGAVAAVKRWIDLHFAGQ